MFREVNKMKKLLCVLLIVLIVIAPVCIAESRDIEGMSTEELVSLLEDAKNELAQRDEDDRYVGAIYSGTYVAGIDIPVGSYDIVSARNTDNSMVVGYYRVFVYQGGENYDEDEDAFKEKAIREYEGNGCHFALSDGDVLRIDAEFVDLFLFRSALVD